MLWAASHPVVARRPVCGMCRVYECRLLDGLAVGPEATRAWVALFLHCMARCAVGVRYVGVAYWAEGWLRGHPQHSRRARLHLLQG